MYNKAREERKWLIWKEAEEKRMRELGVDEETIQKLRAADWEDFKAERRFRERQQLAGESLDWQAKEASSPQLHNVQELLDTIENEEMLQELLTVDKLTLQIAFAKMLGFSSKEIAGRMEISDTAVDMRMWRLRKKLKKFL